MNDMARGYGRLNVREAEQMLRGGLTQTEVTARFALQGKPISQSAISRAIADGRIDIDTMRGRRRAGIPWKLEPKHRHFHAARMLRAAARQDQGLPVGPTIAPQLEAWKRALAEEDCVIHYDPETEEGFWRVPRRPGIDNWYVREPVDDNGNPTPGF